MKTVGKQENKSTPEGDTYTLIDAGGNASRKEGNAGASDAVKNKADKFIKPKVDEWRELVVTNVKSLTSGSNNANAFAWGSRLTFKSKADGKFYNLRDFPTKIKAETTLTIRIHAAGSAPEEPFVLYPFGSEDVKLVFGGKADGGAAVVTPEGTHYMLRYNEGGEMTICDEFSLDHITYKTPFDAKEMNLADVYEELAATTQLANTALQPRDITASNHLYIGENILPNLDIVANGSIAFPYPTISDALAWIKKMGGADKGICWVLEIVSGYRNSSEDIVLDGFTSLTLRTSGQAATVGSVSIKNCKSLRFSGISVVNDTEAELGNKAELTMENCILGHMGLESTRGDIENCPTANLKNVTITSSIEIKGDALCRIRITDSPRMAISIDNPKSIVGLFDCMEIRGLNRLKCAALTIKGCRLFSTYGYGLRSFSTPGNIVLMSGMAVTENGELCGIQLDGTATCSLGNFMFLREASALNGKIIMSGIGSIQVMDYTARGGYAIPERSPVRDVVTIGDHLTGISDMLIKLNERINALEKKG